MYPINFIVVIASGLIPLVVGFIWYNNKFGFGLLWLRESGLTIEDTQKGNILKTMSIALLLGIFIASSMMVWTIHQMGVQSLLMIDETALKNPNSEVSLLMKSIFDKYSRSFRTFKHGAFHGMLGALLFALPVIGVIAVFERKSWKYIALHTGYWVVTLILMGGVICQWA